MISVLIGVNTANPSMVRNLKLLKDNAGMTHFIDAGEATKDKLAKLAAFVSQSISSQSQSLNTGISHSISASI